jgi:hypothetical protein
LTEERRSDGWSEKTAQRGASPSIIRIMKVKEDEMGRARSMNWGEEKCMQDIGGKVRRKETTRKT